MKIEEEISAKFLSPQHKVIVNLRYTQHFLTQMQNSFMASYDLSMAQFNILRILRGSKHPISIQSIKERMVEKSPNTTRLMDKLFEKGLIERSRGEKDKRVVLASISDNGRRLLGRIDVDPSVNALFSLKMTDTDAQILSDLLDKIRISLRK
jgi:MarR family 2-MHQ and catechol resistance regulon transcriptional repressor